MKLFAGILEQTLYVTEALNVLEREGRTAIAERPVFAAYGKNAVRDGGLTSRFDAPFDAIRPLISRRQGSSSRKNQCRAAIDWSFGPCKPSPA